MFSKICCSQTLSPPSEDQQAGTWERVFPRAQAPWPSDTKIPASRTKGDSSAQRPSTSILKQATECSTGDI